MRTPPLTARYLILLTSLLLFGEATIALGSPAVIAPALQALRPLINGYFFGKAMDFLWDKTTGKPDTKQLDAHLKEIEEKLKEFDDSIAATIRDLRIGIDTNTTKIQYVEMATGAAKKINDELLPPKRRNAFVFRALWSCEAKQIPKTERTAQKTERRFK